MLCSRFFRSLLAMMRPDAKVEKMYLSPKPVDFRKSIDGLAALVELDIKVQGFHLALDRPILDLAIGLTQQVTVGVHPLLGG
jgi:hypothetical protein